MPKRQFLFSAVFDFRNHIHRKYSRNWTKQKATFLFFQGLHEVRRRDEGGPRGAHTLGGRGPSPGRAAMWCGHPLGPPRPPFRLYILSVAKTLNHPVIFHEEFRIRRHREDKFRGTESLFGYAGGTGKCPRKAYPSTPPPSSSTLLSPMRRE